MLLNRRQFLLLSAVLAAGCSSPPPGTVRSGGKVRIINAGPANNYAADGVYGRFRALGFFIVRRGNQLFALSAICTHRKCKLNAEPDCSFYCPCHGSTFDPNGHVTEAPAKRDLPTLATFINQNGNLLVTVPAARNSAAKPAPQRRRSGSANEHRV
ncbi:MAG: Rieske 2Fe-2S domain-containing protein [Limisphaerales bacterium]